ncbi:MAG TPA: hypothetical protein VF214_03425 [Edaphobacter sp.]
MTYLSSSQIALFLSSSRPMTYDKAAIVSIVGFIAVVIGTLGNKFYYGPLGASNKVAPLWFGRLMFIGIGIIFIITGMHYLLFEQ